MEKGLLFRKSPNNLHYKKTKKKKRGKNKMGAPIYEKSDEIKEIVTLLLEKRDDIFKHLKVHFWPEMAAYTLRTDKVAPKSQKTVLKIEGVRGAKTVLNENIKFIIHGYKSKWDALSREKKIAYVANMLVRIDFPTQDEQNALAEKGEDFEFGKLRKPDIQDFRSFLAAPGLGIDWADEHTDITNLAEDTEVVV
jgi:hypothetical protein